MSSSPKLQFRAHTNPPAGRARPRSNGGRQSGAGFTPGLLRQLHALIRTIETTPVEDGMTHLGEQFVTQMIASHGPEAVATAILQETSGALLAELLRLIGRVPVNNQSVRRKLIKAGLANASVQVRDAAVQAVALWEDSTCIDLLCQHREPVGWLANYIQGVIEDLDG